MTIGTFRDWKHNNEVSIYASSNAEASTVWLKIKGIYDEDKEATAQLTEQDCKLLIAILEKAIEERGKE